ncbi:MAG: hypothetical protein ABL949_06780 [Fimbriimonadaceae bacterium]
MKRFLVASCLALAGWASADINYTVTVKTTDPAALHIKMVIPNTGSGAIVQIPNWAPGSYRLVDNFKNVSGFKAAGADGKELTFNNNAHTWTIQPSTTTTVEYDMPLTVVDGSVHWSGPSTYMYVADRKQEKCTLRIETPGDWPIYTGLTGVGSQFSAPDYDVLADNPVSTGDLRVLSYVSRGKTHFIAMRGKPKADVNGDYLIKACKHVSDAQSTFFGGGFPFTHYVWHFNVNDSPDGAGGLEHLNSTQISLASGVGPRAVSVLSHEFFHLWNVKRIRSNVLGPFDYTQLPKTGALWWLEGVTDYYAHTFLYRYGWWDRESYYRDIIDNLNQVANNPAHLEVSPHDASYRVGEAANGRGNSQGYRISYYPYGWISGFVLDVELRSRTNSKYSLDDVEKALWQMCKDNQPGFQEDEIRRQLVKFGGYEMGLFYDDVILKSGPLKVEQQLLKLGLRIEEKDQAFANFGFGGQVNADQGYVVGFTEGPAKDKLMSRDVIVKFGDVESQGSRRAIQSAATDFFAKAKVGVVAKVTVVRAGQTIEVEIVPVAGTRKIKSISEVQNASPEQVALRDAFLKVIPVK